MCETALRARQRGRVARLSALLAAAALCAPAVWAQSVAPPQATSEAARGVVLADVSHPVRQLGVEGVTVFDPTELLQFATALHRNGSGKALTAQSVAQAMALMYREDGYPLAEVTWRSEPATGSVVWVVHEGHIEQVSLSGLDEATTARTLRYLTPLTRLRPLRQADLERALALADDLAGTSLSSRVVPASGGDGSVLQVTGEPVLRHGGLVLDVVPMRPGHAQRLHWHEQRYGLLQAGDLVRVYATATRDPNSASSLLGGLHYRAPVGDAGGYIEMLAGNARAERGLTNTLDRSELRGRNASLAWGHPFHRDLHSYGYGIAALEHADSVSRLGDSRPRSQATALRLYLVQGRTTQDERLFQYALTLSAGSRPRASTDDGDRDFHHLRAGLGWAGPWRSGDSVLTYRLEAAAQWTGRQLPRVEKFVLGHFPYLRGYAPAEVDGDKGAGFTLELVRQGDVRNGLAAVKPFGFVSGGRVSSAGPATARSWSLASVGVGLRTTLGERVGFEAWGAVPLRDGPQSRRGDMAVFLSLSVPL
jgi:hemolysin activation/secretion protein